jgi:hypothetical protein
LGRLGGIERARGARRFNFHANRARARANPAPNTPAGWSRVAWFGFEVDEVVVLVVGEVELRVLLGDVVVRVVPVEMSEPGKSDQHFAPLSG